MSQKSVAEDNLKTKFHSEINLIEETEKELAEWMKRKYGAHEVTWNDVKYQVGSANISYLFFLIGGLLFGFSNLKNVSTGGDINKSWLVNTTGAVLIGTLSSGPLMDRFGRKKINLLVSVPCTAAWFMIFFPLSESSMFFAEMGRCLVGLAMGLETSSLVYTAEISHKKYRAFLLSLSTFNFAFGIQLIRIMNDILPWTLIMIVTGGLLVASIILVAYFAPESPVWLCCHRGDLAEAKQSLKWLNPNPDMLDVEWKELTRTLEIEKEWTKRYDFTLLSPAVHKPLTVLFILLTLQQATFLYPFLIHVLKVLSKISPELGVETGYDNPNFLGICRFLVNVISCILYLKIGRRTMFMVSSVGMIVTSILLLILMQFDFSSHFGWNKIVLFSLFIMFGSSGVMTIPWSLTVELLPHGARSVGCAVVTCYGNLLLFLLEAILPSLLDTYSVTLLFAFITVVSAIMSVTFFYLVPETFDRSFGEIQLNFLK